MNISYNRTLYYKYFKVWVLSVVVCLTVSGVVLLASKVLNVEIDIRVIASILFLPLVITSIYGLINNCAMTYSAGHIRTGKAAVYINIFLMVVYLISLIAINS